MSVSEVQSLQRPALLHRCGLNLTSKIKLPVVAVGNVSCFAQVIGPIQRRYSCLTQADCQDEQATL